MSADQLSFKFNVDTSTIRVDQICLRCDGIWSNDFEIRVYKFCSELNIPNAVKEAYATT
jgi:hypothetical protein